MSYRLVTSESVSDGHPDKIADQISDAVLDQALMLDKHARVACETIIKGKWIGLAGELTASSDINYADAVCSVLSEVYNRKVCASELELLIHMGLQSKEIAHGVDHYRDARIGAGDQGVMFGYACNENNLFMPYSVVLSHQLMQQQKRVRQSNPMLGADAKAQVTMAYTGNQPSYVDTVLISTQHVAEFSLSDLRALVQNEILDPIIPKDLITEETRFVINPAGSFIEGGPDADCGLTGRKIIVDTYGGVGHHGGGAFSGKDATKVDRTGAYMARYVAKHIVAADLAERCEVQLAYAIGKSRPVAVSINTFGTFKIPESMILSKVESIFDFSTEAMIVALELNQPIFRQVAAFGHFGRSDLDLPWERLDRMERF